MSPFSILRVTLTIIIEAPSSAENGFFQIVDETSIPKMHCVLKAASALPGTKR